MNKTWTQKCTAELERYARGEVRVRGVALNDSVQQAKQELARRMLDLPLLGHHATNKEEDVA